MKKGSSMIEDIGWSLIMLLIFEILAIIAIIVWIQMTVGIFSGADPIAYSVEFVQIFSKPSMLTEVLSHTKFTDRQFLEQAIEISAVNSLEGAGATPLPVGVKDFMQSYINSYAIRSYEISISNDSSVLVTIDNKQLKCGANSKGFCRSNIIFGPTCDVGYVKINDNGMCGWTETCCSYDPETYAATVGAQKKIAVVSCGQNQVGVCSQGRTPGIRSIPTRSGGNMCDYGEILLRDPVCNTANSGNTKLCCAPDTDETAVATGVSTKAVVPLLYKNLAGTLEVTVK